MKSNELSDFELSIFVNKVLFAKPDKFVNPYDSDTTPVTQYHSDFGLTFQELIEYDYLRDLEEENESK